MKSAWHKLIDKINSNRSCLVITDHLPDQLIFIEAMATVAPGTLVLLAESCDDALELMKRTGIVPDCIFVEFKMPCAVEINFLLRIKRIPLLRRIPVVVHSDTDQRCIVKPLKEIGVSGIYSKPYEVDGIRNALYVYFNRYVFVSSN
jgi:response regulator RpfG family c-di-GMP phosphodiesterase